MNCNTAIPSLLIDILSHRNTFHFTFTFESQSMAIPRHRLLLPFLYPPLFGLRSQFSTSSVIRTAAVARVAGGSGSGYDAGGAGGSVGVKRRAAGMEGLVGGPHINFRERHGTAVEPGSIMPQSPNPEQQKESILAGQKDIPNDRTTSTVGVDAKSTSLPASSSSIPLSSIGTSSPAPSPSSPITPTQPSPLPLEGLTPTLANPPCPVFGPNPLPQSHYFDTYTLVERLTAAGFAPSQSRAIMHLLRTLLHHHLQHAHSHLLSRSTMENDSYLFKAACAELRSEIQALRQRQLDTMRKERAEVQMQFDALNQRFMEDLMVCKDELKGMFNDRKMVNSAEQREVVNKIQELNYKITVLINSDLKSEVEKLRWTTTRRALIAIGLVAAFIVCLIKLGQNNKARERERKAAEVTTAANNHHSSTDNNSHHDRDYTGSNGPPPGNASMEVLAGVNPGLA